MSTPVQEHLKIAADAVDELRSNHTLDHPARLANRAFRRIIAAVAELNDKLFKTGEDLCQRITPVDVRLAETRTEVAEGLRQLDMRGSLMANDIREHSADLRELRGDLDTLRRSTGDALGCLGNGGLETVAAVQKLTDRVATVERRCGSLEVEEHDNAQAIKALLERAARTDKMVGELTARMNSAERKLDNPPVMLHLGPGGAVDIESTVGPKSASLMQMVAYETLLRGGDLSHLIGKQCKVTLGRRPGGSYGPLPCPPEPPYRPDPHPQAKHPCQAPVEGEPLNYQPMPRPVQYACNNKPLYWGSRVLYRHASAKPGTPGWYGTVVPLPHHARTAAKDGEPLVYVMRDLSTGMKARQVYGCRASNLEVL